MQLLRLIAGELLGLFVDDEFLAVVIIAIVALAAVAAWLLQLPALAGAVLVVGCVGVLVLSAWRGARKR